MVTLRFTPTVSNGDRKYIDLAQCLSIVNRRFTSQSMLYTVRGGAIHDSNQNAYVKFNTAVDNWSTRRALKRGKGLWDEQFKMLLKHNPSVKPKYHDYKVHLLANHYVQGFGANLIPVDSQEPSGAPYSAGEWLPSRYFTEDIDWTAPALLTATNRNADEFFAHIVGDHSGSASNWNSVGLIRSWAETAGMGAFALPSDDTVDGIADPLANLFDAADADDERLDALYNDNDQHPYSQQAAPGFSNLQLHRQAFAATSSGAGSIAYFNGFQAINGLIEVDFTVTQSGVVEILLDVEPTGVKY